MKSFWYLQNNSFQHNKRKKIVLKFTIGKIVSKKNFAYKLCIPLKICNDYDFKIRFAE